MNSNALLEENSITSTTKTPQCQNCGNTLTGEFCSVCGQKYPQSRLTIKELLSIAYEAVLDFDRGFFFTVKELFLHPQQVMHSYLNGKRIVYTNPIKYLLIWLGLSTFLAFSVLDIDDFSRQMTREVDWNDTTKLSAKRNAQQEKIKSEATEMQKLVLQNPQFIYVILIPALSFLSFLFFRKKGFTYAEHLLMDTYTMGQTIILTFPSYFLYRWLPSHVLLITTLSTCMAIFYYAFVSLLVHRGGVWSFIKGCFAYLLSYVFLCILVGIGAFIYAIILFSK